MINGKTHKMPALLISGNVKPEYLYLSAAFVHSFEPEATIFLSENKIITSFTNDFERILLESFLDTSYFPSAYNENKLSDSNCFEIAVIHAGNEETNAIHNCKDIRIIKLCEAESRHDEKELSLDALRLICDEIKNEMFKFYRDTLRNIPTKS